MTKTLRLKISLLLNFFVFSILLNTVGIVIYWVVRDYGTNQVTASSLEACKDLTIAAVALLVAAYVPRFGYRRSMIGGLLAVTLASMLVAAVKGFWVTPVLYVVIGASFALMKVSVYSTVGLITTNQKEHTSLLNILEGAFMVGGLTGPQIFAFMIDRSHWNNTYWVIAALTAVALALMLVTPFEEGPVHDEAEQSNFLEMFRLMRIPMVWVFVLCAFFYVMIEQSFGTRLPTFNRDVFHLSDAQSASFLSIFAGSTALSRFVSGALLKKFNWLVVMLVYLGAALVLTAIVLASTTTPAAAEPATWYQAPPLAFAFSAVGFFLGPIYPTICSIVLSKLEKIHQSSMTGLIVVFSALGGTLGSMIVGFATERLSVHNAFFFPMVPMVVLALMLIPYKRLSDRFGAEHYTA